MDAESGCNNGAANNDRRIETGGRRKGKESKFSPHVVLANSSAQSAVVVPMITTTLMSYNN